MMGKMHFFVLFNHKMITLTPIVRKDKNIVFNNRSYPIDFSLLQHYSNHFYNFRNEYQNQSDIEVSDELCDIITDESFTNFISSCQNEEFSLNDSNVIHLYHLSFKFDVPSLKKCTTEYIQNNNINLIFKLIRYKQDLEKLKSQGKIKSDIIISFEEEEKIIVENLFKIIDNEELIDFPVPFLYRILNNPKLETKTMDELKKKKILDFKFKCLDKHKREASILFQKIEEDDHLVDVFSRIVNDYYDIFDFSMIDSCFLMKIAITLFKELDEIKKRYSENDQKYNVNDQNNIVNNHNANENNQNDKVNDQNDNVNNQNDNQNTNENGQNNNKNDLNTDKNVKIKKTEARNEIQQNLILDSLQDFINKLGIFESIGILLDKIIFPESPIKQVYTLLSHKGEEHKNNESLIEPLNKFELLDNLLVHKLFSKASTILIENKSCSKIIEKISIMTLNFDKNLLIELFTEIKFDNNLIDFVDQIFPYCLFNESKLLGVSFWIPLAKMLIKNGIHFSYTIDDNKFEFNKCSKINFMIDFIMNEKDNFSLSKNSAIHWSSKKSSLKIKEENVEQNDFIFYSIAKELSQYMKSSIGDQTVKKLFFKYKRLSEYKSISPSNLIMSLKDIFHHEQMPLINLIWNLVFTLPKNDIINLSKIIHPIESKLLLSSEMMFNNLKRDMIGEIIIWSKWASSFEINTQILFKIPLKGFNFDQELNDIINAVEKEINYLKSAPKSMQEYWNSEDIINIYNVNYIKEMKIYEKIENLKTRLQNSEVPEEYCSTKGQLISKLSLITKFTEEEYNYEYELVNQFLTNANSPKQDNKND